MNLLSWKYSWTKSLFPFKLKTMKNHTVYSLFFFGFLLPLIVPAPSFSSNQKISPSEYIRKSEDNLRGNSQEGQVEMEIHSKGAVRKIKFNYWSKDRNKTLIKILEPAKEAGSGNLRQELNLWRYLANVDRVVKIPPSMMLQSWMGSDFTNDDIVNASSLSNDYTHKIQAQAGNKVVIECIPKPNAPVVWGKIIETIQMPGFVSVEREFYNEKGEKIKTMTGEDLREQDGRRIAFKYTMVNHRKENQKTILRYQRIKFDSLKSDSVFTQNKLKER